MSEEETDQFLHQQLNTVFNSSLQRTCSSLETYQTAPTSLCALSTSPARGCTEGPSTALAASCRPRACRACTGGPVPWSWGTFLDTCSTSSPTPWSATCWSLTPSRALIHVPSGWLEDWQVNVTRYVQYYIWLFCVWLVQVQFSKMAQWLMLDWSLMEASSHRIVKLNI